MDRKRRLAWKECSREKGLEVMNCFPIVAATNRESAAVNRSGLRVLTITSLSISGMRFQSPAATQSLVAAKQIAPDSCNGRGRASNTPSACKTCTAERRQSVVQTM